MDRHIVSIHRGGGKRITRTGDGGRRTCEARCRAFSFIPAGSAYQWRTEGPVDFPHADLDTAVTNRVLRQDFGRDPATAAVVVLEEAVASRRDDGGERLLDDPAFSPRLADLKVRLRALEAWVRRLLEDLLDGGSPGVEVSLVKIRGTELNQDVAEFTVDALGYDALPYAFEHGAAPERPLADPDDGAHTATGGYIFRRAFTILGGSTEIQKNIVSKAMLGL